MGLSEVCTSWCREKLYRIEKSLINNTTVTPRSPVDRGGHFRKAYPYVLGQSSSNKRWWHVSRNVLHKPQTVLGRCIVNESYLFGDMKTHKFGEAKRWYDRESDETIWLSIGKAISLLNAAGRVRLVELLKDNPPRAWIFADSHFKRTFTADCMTLKVVSDFIAIKSKFNYNPLCFQGCLNNRIASFDGQSTWWKFHSNYLYILTEGNIG